MYLEYFGLNDLPFTIAPNPRYLYLTHQHQEALAHLSYGLGGGGGVMLLTGEVGTGKTTISRKLLEDIPEHIEIAWIVNPRLSAEELLASICDELSIAYATEINSIKIFTDLINAYLIEAHGQGRNVVLMIDEAQNLSPDVLEQLRLLTNLETSERKLLQIILLGQPELKTMLERTDLRQLAQRITARYHLQPLSKEESSEYIRHRLAIGGCNRPVFSNKAIQLVFQVSHGTPRLINLLCDRALLGVYSRNESIVEPTHVEQARIEVMGDDVDALDTKKMAWVPVAITLFLLLGSALLLDNIWPWLPVKEDADQSQIGQSQMDQNKMDQLRLTPNKAREQVSSAPLFSIEQFKPAEVDSLGAGSDAQTSLVMVPKTLLSPALISPEIAKKELKVAGSEVIPQSNLQVDPIRGQTLNAKLESIAIDIERAINGSENIAKNVVKETAESIPVSLFPNNPWVIIERTGSKLLAWQTLAEIWGVQITDNDIKPCDQLADKHLSCLNQRANMWLLREYNRPAIFQIKGLDGRSHFAVVRSIQKDQLVIQLNQQHWDMPISEFEQHWQGKISLIWIKPPGYKKPVQLGDSGRIVDWLATQMDDLRGKMIPPQTFNAMNAMLVERIKDFQQSEGLPSYESLGPLTLVRINQRIDQSTPRLTHGALF